METILTLILLQRGNPSRYSVPGEEIFGIIILAGFFGIFIVIKIILNTINWISNFEKLNEAKKEEKKKERKRIEQEIANRAKQKAIEEEKLRKNKILLEKFNRDLIEQQKAQALLRIKEEKLELERKKIKAELEKKRQVEIKQAFEALPIEEQNRLNKNSELRNKPENREKINEINNKIKFYRDDYRRCNIKEVRDYLQHAIKEYQIDLIEFHLSFGYNFGGDNNPQFYTIEDKLRRERNLQLLNKKEYALLKSQLMEPLEFSFLNNTIFRYDIYKGTYDVLKKIGYEFAK